MPITVTGLSAMLAKLETLADSQVMNDAVRQALREGSTLLEQAIVEQAPVRADGRSPNGNALAPGAVRDDIAIYATNPRPGVVADVVTPGSKTRHVAGWVERGHDIVVGGRVRYNKAGKLLASSKGSVVGHTDPNRFLLRAWEATKDKIAATVRESVRARVNEIAKR